MVFDFRALRRFPDVEAPNLQAWDATDELLVQRALAAEVAGDEIVVIGDEYGAIALALTEAGMHGIRVHQDLITGRRALVANARTLDLPLPAAHELDSSLLAGARLVLLQLPKGLAELEEIADAVARWAAPDATLIAGGRVKHMTLAQNEVLGRFFGEVQPQRAERKSRLVVASAARPVPDRPPFPVSRQHDGFTLSAYGAAFAGARLDIGTRVLIDVMATRFLSEERSDETKGDPPSGDGLQVVDLGCGTGALAVAFAQRHPDAVVTATDRSASAARSAQATVVANGLAGRITVTLDDAGAELPDGSADLVLLNPPFHLGAAVHEGAGHRLIHAAARLLRPGGEVWTVFNSHLDHRGVLSRDVGPTEQVARTPKFTVTRSIRRG
ncbi:methyltransferase [Microbacterium esteraromaticum]|uniref:Methyltransferase n=1 Tax=Microbacterium esteraromaticum TaxID=57043 RepID=A0A7D8AIM6_9MICO|nr:methyltransferase [Microbacterium esteraromaticum]QMU96865.1 methyltransferase [Microbacterium esteraromaticum]